MLTAIRNWVVQTMMKGQTGVVRTLPKNDLIELNTQITAERMLRNGINPNDMKTVGQVENVVKQIDTPKVNVNPGVTSVKKADVLDMEGNKIDTSKGIMGGKEIDLDKTNRTVDDLGGDKTDPFSKNFDFENEVKLQTELALKKESDAAIKARIEADNEKNIASMKKKLEDPEEKADGGRIGYAGGSDMGTVADSKGNVGPSKGGYQGGGTGPVERPTGGGGGNNNTNYDYTVPKQILKQTAINTVKNLGTKKLMSTLGFAKFSNPIGIAMALKNFYDQTQNPTLTEEEAMGGGITGMDISTLQSSPYENMAPQFKANGGRIGLLAGSVPKISAAISAVLKNKKKVQQAVDDIFPTGDYKYDAEMAADALVENNPKDFKNLLREDLSDEISSEIYGAVLKPIMSNMAKMRELRKATKPEKTLQSMKEGKGIDMSDPEIADEFGRFMKETDPKGYKELEQTVELSNFKTKGRKENADGGRIGLFMGGANTAGKSVLRQILNYFGKKSDSVKNPSDILRIVNPKRLNELLENPEIYRKFDIEKGIAAPDLIKNMQKQMNVDRKKTIQEMLSSAKNIKSADDNTIKYKNEMIEDMIKKGVDRKMAEEMAGTISKMAENAAGKTNTPKLTDEGILQLENILKNMETGGKKARDLNADGGRIGLKAGMTKRNFLKLMGSVGAGIGAVKSGIFSGLGKGAGKTVAKEVAQQTTSTYASSIFL